MIIRRIREHVAAHNWFAVGIDLAIVVFGLLIATQINNWNERRLERGKADTYRAQLVEELRDNERIMREKLIYYQAVLRHATAALEAFEKPADALDETFLIDASQAAQIRFSPAKKYTYEAMISAGDLELLGKLGRPVGDYYMAVDSVAFITSQYPPYRERLRREIPHDVEFVIRRQCRDIVRMNSDGQSSRSLPATCSIELDEGLVARGIARLRAAPELDRDLSRHIFFVRQSIEFFAGSERRARELRALIERESG